MKRFASIVHTTTLGMIILRLEGSPNPCPGSRLARLALPKSTAKDPYVVAFHHCSPCPITTI